MDQSQVEAIMDIARRYEYPVFFSDDEVSALPSEKVIKGSERIIYIEPVSKNDTEIMLDKLSKISQITAYKVKSWTPDHFDIHITHAEATKSYALEVLLNMINVHKGEVVAAGDANNDLPLFEIAGYKIAMENGSAELKAKADIIAPDVDRDGFAIALESFFKESL